MPSAVEQVRRLIEHSGGHPVVSLYLDLDPEQFATPPARSSQIRSLIDEANRTVEDDEGLEHGERATLREDLKRIESFLESADADFQGARALAVFCSGAENLLESVQLSQPVPGRVIIARAPYVDIREAVEHLVHEDERRTEREALDRLAEGVAGAGRAVQGKESTLEALGERRVEHLLIDPGFQGEGQRCPTCGLLVGSSEESCPADGSALEPVEDLRGAIVELALLQDAEVTVIRHHEDLAQQAVGALLRF